MTTSWKDEPDAPGILLCYDKRWRQPWTKHVVTEYSLCASHWRDGSRYYKVGALKEQTQCLHRR